MPQAYNWNNGTEFTNYRNDAENEDVPGINNADDDAEDDDVGEGDQEARDASEEGATAKAELPQSPYRLASFVESADSFQLNQPETAQAPANESIAHALKSNDPIISSQESEMNSAENDSAEQDVVLDDDEPPAGTSERNEIPRMGMDMGLANSEIGGASWENSSQLALAQFFNDPYLLELITQAFAGNQELKILGEEIRIACNETYARSGEYRPFVTLGAGAGLEKSGRHTRAGAVEEQLEVAPGKEFPDPLPDFLVAADVTWELDIWKKLRNAQYAAAMRYLGTKEGRNYISTRIVAEVAENYYELLALDNRLLTLDKTIEIQEQSRKIAEAKKEAGRGTELAVQRFRAEIRKNQAEKLVIDQEVVETENRINFLLGRFPQRVERISVEYIDLNLHALSAGVPSHLLQNRADIRAAERNVSAAGLDIQVARARFYPSLTLTGGLGWNAFSTGYLFRTPESLIYSVAGELVGPLINKRAIQAAYCTANAAQLQAIYDYQRTVLQAHIEVVNHITKVENYRQSIEVKKRQLDALEASVDVASKLFQNARAEYVEVLLAQREFMEAKMLLIQTKQEQLGAIVNAYQALGGGAF